MKSFNHILLSTHNPRHHLQIPTDKLQQIKDWLRKRKGNRHFLGWFGAKCNKGVLLDMEQSSPEYMQQWKEKGLLYNFPYRLIMLKSNEIVHIYPWSVGITVVFCILPLFWRCSNPYRFPRIPGIVFNHRWLQLQWPREWIDKAIVAGELAPS